MRKTQRICDVIGILLGVAILVAGILFIINPPDAYMTRTVQEVEFGGDYYTEQYNATRAAVVNTAVTANNLREIGRAQAYYFGAFFIALGALTILHYSKACILCCASSNVDTLKPVAEITCTECAQQANDTGTQNQE